MADSDADPSQVPNLLRTERQVFTRSPFQPLTLDNLIKFIKQSSYLYDSTNPLFASSQIRVARWHEIGGYFGTSGETIVRHWLKTLFHYKYVLRKLLIAKLRNEPQMTVPGPWFDKVGSIIGVTFDQAMAEIDPREGLEDCLHRVLLPSHNLKLEGFDEASFEG